jgi:hypothetical protein
MQDMCERSKAKNPIEARRRRGIQRASAALAMAVLAAGLSGCGWFSDPPPPPKRVQAPAGDDKGGTPNLGTVPDRPQTSTAADRAATAGQLSSDRARARYGDDAQPVDETRGATIGSVVGPKPPGSDKEDKADGPRSAPDLRAPGPTAAPEPGASPKAPPRRTLSGAPSPG